METKIETSATAKVPSPPSGNSPPDLRAPPGLSTSLPASRAHYDSVKMKYFQSLGMAKPPLTSSPLNPEGSTAKARSKTTTTLPVPHSETVAIPPSINKKRATSHPIPIKREDSLLLLDSSTIDTFHFEMDMEEEVEENSLGEHSSNSKNSSFDDYSEDSINSSLDDPQTSAKKKFIPPHEMVATNDFNVGTARSVARWESHRRREMMSSN